MTEDLRRTRQYYFRGFSGRHAAARLLLSHSERELRAVIADPTDRNSISGRATYLLRYADGEYDTVRAALHDEICVGLVGLYQARVRCSRIDLSIMVQPPLDRVEIFDESVWVTLFSDAAGLPPSTRARCASRATRSSTTRSARTSCRSRTRGWPGT